MKTLASRPLGRGLADISTAIDLAPIIPIRTSALPAPRKLDINSAREHYGRTGLSFRAGDRDGTASLVNPKLCQLYARLLPRL